MKYESQSIRLNKDFPFSIFKGEGVRGVMPMDVTLHNHHCLELNYAMRGKGVYLIGDSRYSIEAGDIFIINNMEYHMAINTDHLLLKVIVFDPSLVWQGNSMDYLYLKTFFEYKRDFSHRFQNEEIYGEGITLEYIHTIICEMEREWESRRVGYEMVIKALLLKILALLYRFAESSPDSSQKALEFQNRYNRIIDAISFIEAHFQENIRLKQLAELVHMNANYFSTFFRSAMGIPVTGYIMKRRLDYACRLLRTTKLNITEIAYQSGFQSTPYFNRVFKEAYHQAPGAYRREDLQSEGG